jgi:hypothetical protein
MRYLDLTLVGFVGLKNGTLGIKCRSIILKLLL